MKLRGRQNLTILSKLMASLVRKLKAAMSFICSRVIVFEVGI